MEKLTADQFSLFNPTTSEDSSACICSLESQSGTTLSTSPDGPTTAPCGQDRAPVRVSARQAKAKGLTTLATSGRIGLDSSESAALQSCLESRLMTLLDTAGSTLFKLTWKRKRTPLGRRYLERAASVLRTSASGCTSVPTPCTVTGGAESAERKKELGRMESGGGDLQAVALLSAVPSPCTPNGYLVEKLPLSVREWSCPECGTIHDRDANAAVNILAAGHAVTAHGDGVRAVRSTERKANCPRSANRQGVQHA